VTTELHGDNVVRAVEHARMLGYAIFTLPLHCAPLMNTYARMHWAKRKKLKSEAMIRLLAQGVERRKRPLPGKPLVRIMRYSSTEPDGDSGYGSKIALDCLKADRQGLGWIRDDSPDAIELELRWEKAKPRGGALLIEVVER
jgi:hypothetical protein